MAVCVCVFVVRRVVFAFGSNSPIRALARYVCVYVCVRVCVCVCVCVCCFVESGLRLLWCVCVHAVCVKNKLELELCGCVSPPQRKVHVVCVHAYVWVQCVCIWLC